MPDRCHSLRFKPGRLLITPGAMDLLERAGQDPLELLGRHLTGDWGCVCPEDREAAIDTITGYTLVRSASLTQQGDVIELKLVVNPIATDEHARNLGDNFVRLAKSLFDEGHPPNKQIGPGSYDYHIMVIWWPDQVFDRGEKLAAEADLRW